MFKRKDVMRRLSAALSLPLLVLNLLGLSGNQENGNAERTARFRVRSELVHLSVSIVDRAGRPWTGLRADDIRVFEDKVEQEVEYFIPDASPLAQGLILDSSGSMRHDFKIMRARAAALHFVATGHPEDEVFLIDFDSSARLTLDFTSDREALRAALESAKANGKTALYDAVYLALTKLRAYPSERRKVILLITDGADTNSVYELDDVFELARESAVQIYAVGILGRDMTRFDVRTIQELAEMSGGQAFFPTDPRQMVDICLGIAANLHQQYVLGYRSTNPVRDGKWRKIQLKIKQDDGRPHLLARTRDGYYAPSGFAD